MYRYKLCVIRYHHHLQTCPLKIHFLISRTDSGSGFHKCSKIKPLPLQIRCQGQQQSLNQKKKNLNKKKKKLNKKKKINQAKRTLTTGHYENWAVCTFLFPGQLQEGHSLGRTCFETKAVLFIHTRKSHSSPTPQKKKSTIEVKEFLMQIKRPFIFKKKCRDYSKNKLFWTSPLAYMCSVRWNYWCQSTNSKAGKSRQWQPLSQNFREKFGRAVSLEF